MATKNNPTSRISEDQKSSRQPKAKPTRTYKWAGKADPEGAKGQVTTVLAALKAVKEGPLEAFIAKVQEINPAYKTKTPMAESVKFHLHVLARRGLVIEVDQEQKAA